MLLYPRLGQEIDCAFVVGAITAATGMIKNAEKVRSRAELADDFRSIGIAAGDILYLRAAVGKVGPTATGKSDAFMGAALDAVGTDGTLVAPAFKRQYPIWRRDIPLADQDRAPSTGALSDIMIGHPDAVRSEHPTHSFVAIGRRATEIVAGHTAQVACFEPIRRVVAAGGKAMLVGCVADSPGFSTVHLAQFDLGLTRQHYLRFLYHVKMRDEAGRAYFARGIESPSCSAGFGRFYLDYVVDENLHTGYVGSAWSVWVDAARAYRSEIERLRQDPTYALCSRPTCVRCRVLSGYNLSAAPMALLRRANQYLSGNRPGGRVKG